MVAALFFAPLGRLQAADAPRESQTGLIAEQWTVFETSFSSERKYDNAFLDVQVDVIFRQGEHRWTVPAFWAGGDKWVVRFAPPTQGAYSFQVTCSDPANMAMNGAAGKTKGVCRMRPAISAW
jgi:hypothetical protein